MAHVAKSKASCTVTHGHDSVRIFTHQVKAIDQLCAATP